MFRIRIHLIIWYGSGSRLNTDLDTDPGFWWPKIEKIYSWKKNIKKCYHTIIYLSLDLHKGSPSYKRSLQPLQREHSALQNMKFLYFFHFFVSFLSSWIRIRIRIHWPDWIWIRIRSTEFYSLYHIICSRKGRQGTLSREFAIFSKNSLFANCVKINNLVAARRVVLR